MTTQLYLTAKFTLISALREVLTLCQHKEKKFALFCEIQCKGNICYEILIEQFAITVYYKKK